MMDNYECPFCGEDEFDLPGLKQHLSAGWCEVWNQTIDLPVRFGREIEATPDVLRALGMEGKDV
jgi:hypothetical protein